MRFWNSIFGNSDNNENREQDGSKGKDKGTAKGFERLFSQSLKKKGALQSRKLQIEQFEAREMLSIDGPQLNSIFINQDQQRSISDEPTLYIAPTSFLLRFSEGQAIDPTSLGGIQVYRSGGDGVFSNDISGTNSLPDVKVEFGYIGVGDYENEVIIRFAENLPDDLYQIRLVGGGNMTDTKDLNDPSILKSVNAKAGTKESFYNASPDARYGDTSDIQTVRFDLKLGAKVTSIVTQPTSRNADGTLSQSRNTIEVYFTDDELNLPADPTKLFQLIATQNTLNPDDDLVVYPTKVDYKYNAVVDGVKVNRAILTFEKDAAGNAITDLAQIGTGSFRLRLGETYHKTDTRSLDLIDAEPGDTFKTSYKIEVKDFNTASANPQSLVIHGQINRQYDPVEYPGGRDDPGHRDLPRNFGFDGDNHIGGDTTDGAKDVQSGVNYRYYNFRDVLGVNPKGGTYRNSISEAQKELARTIFDMYSRYLGIQFIETADMGITVATGDLAWLGGVSGELLYGRSDDANGAILDGSKNWGTDVYGGAWFNTAFHEIGHCLGFDDAYDLMPGTNMTAGAEDSSTVTDGNGIALNIEQTYPGAEDIIHGLNMYRPDSNDIDMYEFTLAAGGNFSAEIYAQRASSASQLNADLKIYQQVKKILGKKSDGTDEVFITYELVAQNDDYFGKDPFVELYLPAGVYYVAVTSTGNDDINPQMSGTGGGGRTIGNYELRLNYSASGVDRDNPNTFKDNSGNYIVDKDGIKLDGDDDMVPGGAYDYWFNVQKSTSTPTTTDVSQINRTLYVDNSGRKYNADGTPVAIDPEQTRDPSLVGNGTLSNPFKTIKNALERAAEVQQQLEAYAKANPLEKIDTMVIVRIVGNNLTGNIKETKAYEIGTNAEDRNKATLTDGATFDIPKGVSVVIDAGVVIKLGGANITVGSADLNIDRSGGSLQVLGTPVHKVYFTSYLDETIGRDTYPLTTTAKPSDWGGIVIRNDVDYEFIDNYDASSGKNRREVLEKQGIFLNYVNNGDFRYGGMKRSEYDYQPICIVDARPTVTYNTITYSAHAAMSATPKSFEETRYQNWDHLNPFTTDIVRVGPHIHGNIVVSNSMNGLLVDTKTPINTQTVQKVEIAARFDDLDIVHILTENLIIAGHSGSNVLTQATAPSMNLTDWVNNIRDSSGKLVVNVIGYDSANRYNDTYLDQKLTFTKVPEDREYFSLTDGETKVTFEFNRVDVAGQGYNNINRVQAGRVCIDIESTDTVEKVVAKTIAAINAVQANKEILVNLSGETGQADSTRALYLLATQRLTPDQFKIKALQDPDGYEYALALKGTGQRIDVNGVGLIKSRSNGSLVVNPGVIVKANNSRIELEYGAQLLAEGTENQPIIFTSLYDNRFGGGGTFNTSSKADGLALGTAMPGNWSGIVQFPNSNLSMDHTVFAYAGGSSRIEGNLAKFNPIEIREADARITNSRFEFNTGNTAGNYVTDRSGRGMITPSVIYVRGSQPIIIGNEFYSNRNFKADGVTQETDNKKSLSVISINANAFTDEIVVDKGRSTGGVGRHIEFDDNYGPLVRLNRYTDNTLNGLVVRGEVLTTESVWDDADITHVLFNEIVIPNFHSTGGLRLMSENGSSLVVKLLTDNSTTIGKDTSPAGFTTTGKPLEIDDRIGGSMQVVGVPGYPVIFTSLKDDTVGSGFDIKGQVMYDTNNTAKKGDDGQWTDASVPQPGDWRSIKFERYSHDRNVLVVKEFEKAGSLEDTNGRPGKDGNSQYLGYLAPDAKSGDDLQRLGFEVHGSIRATDPTDSDVYHFTAQAGTEVWIDIDWTGRGLDTVLEVIDADGNILASSDNSFYEGPDEQGRYINRVYDHDYDPAAGDHGTTIGFNGGVNAFGLNKDTWERVTIGATADGANGVGYNDKYSTNVRDAGLRYVCEGSGEKDYYVRVRSVLSISWANGLTKAKSHGKEFYIEDTQKQRVTYRLDFDKEGIEPNSNSHSVVIGLAGVDSKDYAATIIKAINGYTSTANRNLKVLASLSKYSLDDANPVVTLNGVGLFFNPQDTGLVAQENSSGFYQLQIRLQEMDEVPGCSVAYADIRYAINGIEAYGFPQHSPILGEVQLGNGHKTYNEAQKIGNLLESDKGTVSVAGYLASLNDVNWYTFDLELAGIQNIKGVTDGTSLWSTIFDIDYADGLARPDLSIWVFNQSGQLIYMGSDSNVADDRPGPTGTRPNSYPEGTISKLSAGSVGGNDPFIGPALLQANVKGDPTKTYFVAVTSKYVVPDAVGDPLNVGKADNAKTRVEPIDTITRVIEEHVNGGQNFGWNTNDPGNVSGSTTDVELAQRLVLTPDEYHISDVPMYVSYAGNPTTLAMINPSTGQEILRGNTVSSPWFNGDVAMTYDGRLIGTYTPPGITCYYQNIDPGNFGNSKTTSENPTGVQDTYIYPCIPQSETAPQFNTGGGYQVNAMATARPNNRYSDVPFGNRRGNEDVYTVVIGSLPGASRYNGAINNVAVPYYVTSNENVMYLLRSDGVAINANSLTSSNTAARFFSNMIPIQTFQNHDLDDSSDLYYGTNGDGPRFNCFQEIGETIQALTFSADGSRLICGTNTGAVYEIHDWDVWAYTTMTNPNGIQPTGRGAYLEFLGYLLDDNGRVLSNLSGFSVPPQTVEGGIYKDLLYTTTSNGQMFAFDVNKLDPTVPKSNSGPVSSTNSYVSRRESMLSPIFVGSGSAKIDSKIVSIPSGATGICFSPVDYNLWHRTGYDSDHIWESPSTIRSNKEFDGFGEQEQSLRETGSGTSWYFGMQTPTPYSWIVDPQPNIDWMTKGDLYHAGPSVTGFNQGLVDGVPASYDLPGGTYGGLTSNTFSLADYTAGDKPSLYFSYRADTETSQDWSLQDYGDDGLMVFVCTDGSNWQRVSSACFDLSLGTNVGDSHHQDPYNYVDQVADNQWRQARIDLSRYAGQKNVQLKFFFSTTGGEIGYGAINQAGSQVIGVAASHLFDTRNGVLNLPDRSKSSGFKPGSITYEQVRAMANGSRDAINTVSDSAFILGDFGDYGFPNSSSYSDKVPTNLSNVGSAVVYEYEQGWSLYIPTAPGGQGQAELNDYFEITTVTGTKQTIRFGDLVGNDLNLLRKLNSEEFMTRLIDRIDVVFNGMAKAYRYTEHGGTVSSSNPYIGQQIYFEGVLDIKVVGDSAEIPLSNSAKRQDQFVVSGGVQNDIIGDISRMSNTELYNWLMERSAVLSRYNYSSEEAYLTATLARMNKTVPIPVRGNMTAEQVSASVAFMVNLTMNDDLKVYLKANPSNKPGTAWASLDTYFNFGGHLLNLPKDDISNVTQIILGGNPVGETILMDGETIRDIDTGDVYQINNNGRAVLDFTEVAIDNGHLLGTVDLGDYTDIYRYYDVADIRLAATESIAITENIVVISKQNTENGNTYGITRPSGAVDSGSTTIYCQAGDSVVFRRTNTNTPAEYQVSVVTKNGVSTLLGTLKIENNEILLPVPQIANVYHVAANGYRTLRAQTEVGNYATPSNNGFIISVDNGDRVRVAGETRVGNTRTAQVVRVTETQDTILHQNTIGVKYVERVMRDFGSRSTLEFEYVTTPGEEILVRQFFDVNGYPTNDWAAVRSIDAGVAPIDLFPGEFVERAVSEDAKSVSFYHYKLISDGSNTYTLGNNETARLQTVMRYIVSNADGTVAGRYDANIDLGESISLNGNQVVHFNNAGAQTILATLTEGQTAAPVICARLVKVAANGTTFTQIGEIYEDVRQVNTIRPYAKTGQQLVLGSGQSFTIFLGPSPIEVYRGDLVGTFAREFNAETGNWSVDYDAFQEDMTVTIRKMTVANTFTLLNGESTHVDKIAQVYEDRNESGTYDPGELLYEFNVTDGSGIAVEKVGDLIQLRDYAGIDDTTGVYVGQFDVDMVDVPYSYNKTEGRLTWDFIGDQITFMRVGPDGTDLGEIVKGIGSLGNYTTRQVGGYTPASLVDLFKVDSETMERTMRIDTTRNVVENQPYYDSRTGAQRAVYGPGTTTQMTLIGKSALWYTQEGTLRGFIDNYSDYFSGTLREGLVTKIGGMNIEVTELMDKAYMGDWWKHGFSANESEQWSGYNTVMPDGTVRRGTDNKHVGVYIDNIIVGAAERGEMVTNAPTNTTGFYYYADEGLNEEYPFVRGRIPKDAVTNGGYQLEIRRGAENVDYIRPEYNTNPEVGHNATPISPIHTNERLTNGITLVTPNTWEVYHGQRFSLTDGTNKVEFVFFADQMIKGAGDAVQIIFNQWDTQATLAEKIIAAINGAYFAGRFKVTASEFTNSNLIDLFGATDFKNGGLLPMPTDATIKSEVYEEWLFNNGESGRPIKHIFYGQQYFTPVFEYNGASTMYSGDQISDTSVLTRFLDPTNTTQSRLYIDRNTMLGDRIGDENLEREKGQLNVFGTTIMYSREYGLRIESASREKGIDGGPTHPGGVMNQQNSVITRTTDGTTTQVTQDGNSTNFVSGIAVMNNIFAYNGLGGIFLTGQVRTGTDANGAATSYDARDPQGPVPFVRIVNNTFFGSLLVNEGDVYVGKGIEVGPHASPTIMNNIFSNLAVGIDINSDSKSSVLVANVFKNNTTNIVNGTINQEFDRVLGGDDPLFVAPEVRNFYLRQGSKAIDAAAASLQERTDWYKTYIAALGIPESAIYAPTSDIYGQVRKADETSSSGGTGFAYIDMGAVDRVDIYQPTVNIISPQDRTKPEDSGDDRNPDPYDVFLVGKNLTEFVLQLSDVGIGIDDLSVADQRGKVYSHIVTILEQSWDTEKQAFVVKKLVLDKDFFADYNAANDQIFLTPTKGRWSSNATYTILVDNDSVQKWDMTFPEGDIYATIPETTVDGTKHRYLKMWINGTEVNVDTAALKATDHAAQTKELSDAIVAAIEAAALTGSDGGKVSAQSLFDADGNIIGVTFNQAPFLQNDNYAFSISSSQENKTWDVSMPTNLAPVFANTSPLEFDFDGTKLTVKTDGFEEENKTPQGLIDAIAQALQEAKIVGPDGAYVTIEAITNGAGAITGFTFRHVSVLKSYDTSFPAVKRAVGMARTLNGVRDLAGNPLNWNRADGQAYFTVVLSGYDYGDAGYATVDGVRKDYPTLYNPSDPNAYARHVVWNGYCLGNGVTIEPDGKPNQHDTNADGTMIHGDEYEDGVIGSVLIPGKYVEFTVNVSAKNPHFKADANGYVGYVNAFFDWGRDGNWNGADDRVQWMDETGAVRTDAVPVKAGSNTIKIFVPATFTNDKGAQEKLEDGEVFARFRFSSQKILGPTGDAPDGEVEDYKFNVALHPKAFGTAPQGQYNDPLTGLAREYDYPVMTDRNGAWHATDIKYGYKGNTATRYDASDDESQFTRTGALYIGSNAPVSTPDGKPALNKDRDATKDGIDLSHTIFIAGQTSKVDAKVHIPVALQDMLNADHSKSISLDAWFDFQNKGTWDDTATYVHKTINYADLAAMGADDLLTVTLDVAVPSNAEVQKGVSFARFRVNSMKQLTSKDYVGPDTGETAIDGEVQDVMFYVLPYGTNWQTDFDDAKNYGTAVHKVVNGTDGKQIKLGELNNVQFDPVKFPNAVSSTLDDNDGALFPSFEVGDLKYDNVLFTDQETVVTITASHDGYVSLWIDLNGDGVYEDGERIHDANDNAYFQVKAGTHEYKLNLNKALNGKMETRARIRYTDLTVDHTTLTATNTETNVIANGEVEDYLVLLLGTSCSISGTVYNDFNGNGRRDTIETGIPGVTVVLLDENKQPTGRTTVTNSQGVYTFDSLYPGNYYVQQLAIPTSSGKAWIRTSPKDGYLSVTLPESTDVTGEDFGNFLPGTVSIGDTYVVEGSTGGTTTVKVPVYLTGSFGAKVQVEVQTIDGTAVAGHDFVGGTAKYTFPSDVYPQGTWDIENVTSGLGETGQYDSSVSGRVMAYSAKIGNAYQVMIDSLDDTSGVYVLTNSTRDSIDPQVLHIYNTEKGINEVHVVWSSFNGSTYDLYYTYGDATNLATLSTNIVKLSNSSLIPPGLNNLSPQISEDASGNVQLAWLAQYPQNYSDTTLAGRSYVMMQRVNPSTLANGLPGEPIMVQDTAGNTSPYIGPVNDLHLDGTTAAWTTSRKLSTYTLTEVYVSQMTDSGRLTRSVSDTYDNHGNRVLNQNLRIKDGIASWEYQTGSGASLSQRIAVYNTGIQWTDSYGVAQIGKRLLIGQQYQYLTVPDVNDQYVVWQAETKWVRDAKGVSVIWYPGLNQGTNMGTTYSTYEIVSMDIENLDWNSLREGTELIGSYTPNVATYDNTGLMKVSVSKLDDLQNSEFWDSTTNLSVSFYDEVDISGQVVMTAEDLFKEYLAVAGDSWWTMTIPTTANLPAALPNKEDLKIQLNGQGGTLVTVPTTRPKPGTTTGETELLNDDALADRIVQMVNDSQAGLPEDERIIATKGSQGFQYVVTFQRASSVSVDNAQFTVSSVVYGINVKEAIVNGDITETLTVNVPNLENIVFNGDITAAVNITSPITSALDATPTGPLGFVTFNGIIASGATVGITAQNLTSLFFEGGIAGIVNITSTGLKNIVTNGTVSGSLNAYSSALDLFVNYGDIVSDAKFNCRFSTYVGIGTTRCNNLFSGSGVTSIIVYDFAEYQAIATLPAVLASSGITMTLVTSAYVRPVSTYQSGDNVAPRLCGSRVVWRNSDPGYQIYYDPITGSYYYYLTNTGREDYWNAMSVDINDPLAKPVIVSDNGYSAWNPQLSEDRVVWRAQVGTDYQVFSATYQEPVLTGYVTFQIMADTAVELDEYFSVKLVNASLMLDQGSLVTVPKEDIIGQKDTGYVWILNDDGPMDYGDLPNTYSTLLASDGPRHGVASNNPLALYDPKRSGVPVDTEKDGQPNATATGDDVHNSQGLNDEQGVVFGTYDQYNRVVSSPWIPGQKATISITVTEECYLNAFVDWNRNGIFGVRNYAADPTDPSKFVDYDPVYEYYYNEKTGVQEVVLADERFERIFDLTDAQKNDPVFMSELYSKGYKLTPNADGSPIEITFTVPRDAKTGSTGARFRVSSAGGLNFTGYAADGEVEDYIVEIQQATKNPVRRLEGTNSVVVTGSVLRDELVINRSSTEAKYLGQLTIQLNGTTYTAKDLGMDTIEDIFFDGIYGSDVVTVYGLADDAETVRMTPYSTNSEEVGTFIQGTGLTIRLINAPNVTFDGGTATGGKTKAVDTVTMFDSNESDALTLRPGYGQMKGAFYTNTVQNVTNVNAESIHGGYDTVFMYGTTNSGDTFRMTDTGRAILRDKAGTFTNTASSFADVQVFNLGGSGNTANVDVSGDDKNTLNFSRGPQSLGNSLDIGVFNGGSQTGRIRVFGFDSQSVLSNANSTTSTAVFMGTPQNEFLYGGKKDANNDVRIFAWDGTTDPTDPASNDDYILELLAYNAVKSVTAQSIGQGKNKAQVTDEVLQSLLLEPEDGWIVN